VLLYFAKFADVLAFLLRTLSAVPQEKKAHDATHLFQKCAAKGFVSITRKTLWCNHLMKAHWRDNTLVSRANCARRNEFQLLIVTVSGLRRQGCAGAGGRRMRKAAAAAFASLGSRSLAQLSTNINNNKSSARAPHHATYGVWSERIKKKRRAHSTAATD